MNGKLIKTSKDSYHNGHYFLNDSDGFAIGSTDKDWCKRAISKNPLYILSLKNCEAIENGYDLDELAWKEFPYHEWEYSNGSFGDINEENRETFKIGFQKALEILGDKKFNEEDMRDAMITAQVSDNIHTTQDRLDFIQSLQQTEWLVEIEMVCPHPSDTYKCGIQYGCDEDGCNHPNQVPYLDDNGYLILKRK